MTGSGPTRGPTRGTLRKTGRALALAGISCALGLRASAEAGGAPSLTVIPRIVSPPVLDGDLADECWERAATLGDFTKPDSAGPPAKRIAARVCFDREALYVAFDCEEPNPERMRAEELDGPEVWKDDCVEIWIRTTDDLYEFDQFIVTSAGKRGALRRRRIPGEPWSPDWRAAARVGRREWRAEVRIPFRSLGLEEPRPAQMVQLKLGREDRTSRLTRLSTWPPGSPYAGAQGYAPAYFEKANLVRNPDFTERRDGRAVHWGFSKGDEARFAPAREGGRDVIRIACPGRYCVLQQSLRLRPGALYRLEADVKGTAGLYLRVRTVPEPGGPSRPHTVWVEPADEFRRHELRFVTGPTGEALLIIGTTEKTGEGQAHVAGLGIVREVSTPVSGPAIRVAAVRERGEPEPFVVKKLLVTDCRAVRGFIGTPVDGTLESRGWNGSVWEYNRPRAGAGVGYAYRRNDGLHIEFGDGRGFNAVLVRGGVRAKLYRDCPSYEGPKGGVLLAEFPGRTGRSRLFTEEPFVTRRVSFFDVGDGYISDVSFFRTGRGSRGYGRPEERLGLQGIMRPGIPELEARFSREDRATYWFGRGRKYLRIGTRPGRTVHLVGAPLEEETALAAVGLDLELADAPSPLPFSAHVQDPLNPRRELFGADFELDGPGRLRLVLDFPDQIVPAGTKIWLSLKFDLAAAVSGPGGESPVVELYTVPRETALPEALAHRKLLMKSFFAALSEPRPWNNWYTDRDIEKSMQGPLGPQLLELRETIDQCRALDADDPTVRQYYEWFWRKHRPWRKEHGRGVFLDGSHAKLPTVPGAPEWATVARQAWLEARKVPEWWLDNRLVPTGEFGGEVGDDTDMYQNYADFVMFESDGVAARLKDAAGRLAELVEERTLTKGLNRATTDPLHAYEEGVNHEAMMAWWFYGDPVYLERCIVAARSTEALTVITPRGHRHFKSQTCGASDLRMERKTDVDGHAHPLMWHPSFEVAWYNASPRVLETLGQWADGWLEHMEPGKYAVSVEVATERVTHTTDRPLYGGYGALGSAFEFLYWITGDRKYLGPFIEHYGRGKARTSPDNILTEILHRSGPEALKAEVGEGLGELAGGAGAAAAALTGDKSPLIDALRRDIAELQSYFEMYTSAEPFTDRVFLNGITNAAIAYTGGYATRNKFSHTHAVSYEGFGTDYAALVLRAGRSEFRALLYSFAPQEMAGRVRFWTLDHGRYRLSLAPDENADDRPDGAGRTETLEIARATAVPVALPPGKVMILELAMTERLDDVRGRADLALSPLDMRLVMRPGGDRELVGLAHNIGSRAALDVEVALVDAAGRKRARRNLGRIEAPLDLVPRTKEFRLRVPTARVRGWTVVIDPDDGIPEIYEGNNRVELDSARAEPD